MKDTKPVRQEKMWLSKEAFGARGTGIPVPVKPWRVWTEIQDVVLPTEMKHNVNGFMEDHIHDWVWRNGTLYFYSRVSDGDVNIILEWKE